MSNLIELARAQSARFWSKVDKTGECWIWTAGKDKDGYGKFAVTLPRVGLPTGAPSKQRHMRAHIFSWEMANGCHVPEGSVIMHSCDTPACVNPAHLSPGTQAENRADCGAKGRNAAGSRSGAHMQPHRMPRGERHYAATITEANVRDIRALSAQGIRPKAISDRLKIGFTKVWGVTSGRTWKSVA
jgi:hypothetical protein